MGLFRSSKPTSDIPEHERIAFARLEWWAQLCDLNGDATGAELCRQSAADCEALSVLRAKLAKDPTNTLLQLQEDQQAQKVHQDRKYWRDIRAMSGVLPVRTFDNFTEPSDKEILDGLS